MSDDTISRLFARLDETDRVSAAGFARLEARMDALPCGEHHRLLAGNGHRGLVERVTIVETAVARFAEGVARIEAASDRQTAELSSLAERLSALETSERRRSRHGWIVQTALASAVASAVVGGLWAVLTHAR